LISKKFYKTLKTHNNMSTFISMDCETNGLHGRVYSVAFIRYENGVEKNRFCGSCPILGEKADWILQNPHLETVEGATNYTNEFELFAAASAWWKKQASTDNKDNEIKNSWGYTDFNGVPTLYHCGMIVEGGFFRRAVELGFLGQFEAPMAPIEVADFLRFMGENPYSVDSYAAKHGIDLPVGQTHNPIYDCQVAAAVYLDIIRKM
jgi:DNA polymerase III epsilon subunit-like protein